MRNVFIKQGEVGLGFKKAAAQYETMDEDEPEPLSAEMRFIALELMKIAAQRKTTFEKVAEEYIGNTYLLNSMIEESLSNPIRFGQRKAGKAK
jgi:hypothetical protein